MKHDLDQSRKDDVSDGCEHDRMLFKCLCQPSSFLASKLNIMASFQVLLLDQVLRCSNLGIISTSILPLLLALEVLSCIEMLSCKFSPKNSDIAKLPNDQNDMQLEGKFYVKSKVLRQDVQEKSRQFSFLMEFCDLKKVMGKLFNSF